MSMWRSRADAVAASMMDNGALGVALMGSHARGDAHPLSDVDIVALGSGAPAFREEDGVILSTSWVEPDAAMASFTTPHELVTSPRVADSRASARSRRAGRRTRRCSPKLILERRDPRPGKEVARQRGHRLLERARRP